MNMPSDDQERRKGEPVGRGGSRARAIAGDWPLLLDRPATGHPSDTGPVFAAGCGV